MIVRFDDISINTDLDAARAMTCFCQDMGAGVMWAISPLVHDIPEGENPGRVFPGILKAYSNHTVFFCTEKCGTPSVPDGVIIAAHGIVHVDHRLLSEDAQKLSILTSCSLAGCSTFVPPFNKWNNDTEVICKKYDIQLVRFEEGWLSMEHNDCKPDHKRWYLHSRRWTPETFRAWWGLS